MNATRVALEQALETADDSTVREHIRRALQAQHLAHTADEADWTAPADSQRDIRAREVADVREGVVAIYDPEEEDAWCEADIAVERGEMR